ncbi:MAG: thioredoxin [Flavobacterium sp.]|nr:thioredoxin [Flavobacterium sp.]
MKTNIIFSVVIGLLFISCQGQKSEAVKNLSATEFAEKIKNTPDGQLIDVRTPGEYGAGNISNSRNIDWNGDQFEAEIATLDKSKPVLVYCKSGGRSGQAAEKLQKMGFTEIYNMNGGFLKWESAGLTDQESLTGMSTDEYQTLIGSDKKVLVNFSAVWCAPCKKMKPYLERMQEEMKDSLTVIRLDADQQKIVMKSLNLDEIPALLLYENGKLSWKHTGFISEQDLKNQL